MSAWLRKMAELFLENRRKMKKWHRLVSFAAILVVFVMTYALVLPAITMDRETSDNTPGVYVESDGKGSSEEHKDTGSSQSDEEDDQDAESGPETSTLIWEDNTAFGALSEESTEMNQGQTVQFSVEADDGSYSVTVIGGKNSGLNNARNMHIREIGNESGVYKEYEKKLYGQLQKENTDENGIEADGNSIDADAEKDNDQVKSVIKDLRLYAVKFTDESGKIVRMKGTAKITWRFRDGIKVGKKDQVRAFSGDKSDEKADTENDDFWAGKVKTKREGHTVNIVSYELQEDGITGIAVVGEGKKVSEDQEGEENQADRDKESEDLVDKESDEEAGTNKEDETAAGDSSVSPEGKDYQLQVKGKKYKITVGYDDKARIPEGADLVVEEILPENKKYDQYYQKAMEKAGERVVTSDDLSDNYARFFDIEIQADGKKIEPKAAVSVRIELADAPEDEKMAVVHFEQIRSAEKTVVVDADARKADDIRFEADSFSVYGVIVERTSNIQAGEYMVVVKQGDSYYIVLNDGTLSPADYNPENKTVAVDDPMMWKYDGERLYHITREAGFTGDDIASDSYYRYIDPNETSGLNEDSEDNTVRNVNGREVHITTRNLWNVVKLRYSSDHKLQSASNSAYYIGVEGQNQLSLKGHVGSDEAAEIFLADPLVTESDWTKHRVNHIDISINGTAEVDVPLAYGKYYDENGKVVKEVPQNKFEKLHLTQAQVVNEDELSITPEDMKRAHISASCKGENLDNAFYITGYSGNAEHAGQETGSVTSPQVRIEGSFLTANMPAEYAEVETSRYDSDQSYRTAIRNAHLANKVEYNVSVVKSIQFYLEMPVYDSEGKQLEDDQGKPVYQRLYDADGNPLKIKADVAFSDSFNYWDEDNVCPVFTDTDRWYYYKNYRPNIGNDWNADNHEAGDVARCNFSGMDFKLGADSDTTAKVYAVEITKIVVDENGNRIKSNNAGTNKFYIYKNSDGVDTMNYEGAVTSYVKPDKDDVKGLDIGSFTQTPDYSGYALQNEKTISVGSEGLGLVYDYDVQPGRYYIKEDPSSIHDHITDTSGKTWDYKNTYILTEYAWRNHANDNYMHVSDTFTKNASGEYESSAYSSVPEILGLHYGYNGTDGPYTNDFLEFYVYNVYESPKVDVPVIKTWEDFEDDQYDWQVSFKLQWAPLYAGEDRPSVSFRDVTPIQTMTINKSDSITQELITRYLSGDDTLTEEETARIEAITFKNLPKYGTDSNGNTFRYQYSLEETSYRVTNATTGVILYSWSETDGYNDPDESTHYQPFYPHDAGETEEGNTAEQNEADTNYYIDVRNAQRNISGKEEIDISLDKQWDINDDDNFDTRDESYWAEFELRRFVHTEHRDISHMSDADRTADPITITIKNGDTVVHSLQVQPNVGLYLGGNFLPHDTEKSVTFTANHPVRLANDSRVTTMTAIAEGHNMSNALVRSQEFFITQDTVFTISEGIENLVTSNPAKVLDTGAGTSPLPDRSFSQTIRLDNSNSWHVDLADLIRSETSAGDDDDNENVTYYEYYLVEKDGNPKGYARYFRAEEDDQGNIVPTDILSGDSDHQIEHDDKILAVNGPANRLIVKKNWRGVPDTTGFPTVTFTLYQAWADGNEGWVYENPETHARYEHIELKGNSLEWICPEVLPATRLDGSTSRAVKYYVVEDVREGSETKEGITTSWRFYYYINSKGQQTNAGHQGYFASLNGSDLASDGGTITICNKMDQYMQLDIQKQFFKMEEAGSWNNVTATSDMKKNAILGFKMIRAIKDSDGKWLDERGNESSTPVWMDYGEEMLCGYDENGQTVVHRGENDIFWLHDAGGDWHFRIEDNQGDATNVNAGGAGLPSYGFYIKNGEDIPVEYWYSVRETNVYKDLNRTPYPEWDWFSSITPVNAHGPNGQIMEAFPKAFSGQDSNRIANFQASDLIIDKDWIGDPAASAVYVKIWRTSGDGAPEDFTAIIAEDIRNNHNWQMYVNDPAEMDLNHNTLIIKPTTDPETGDSIWEDAIKVNRILLGTLSETGKYHYFIQEVGYRTASGEYRTNVNGAFKPLYDHWVGNATEGSYTGSPVGMNEYAGNNIPIGAKGENRLKVINRTSPSTSYTVTKSFHGPQSSTGGQSSVTGKYPTDGSKQVVMELQQRYRYEKTEDGVDYVSADHENWVRADSKEAAITWCNYDSKEGWQSAESASPVSVTLPLEKPEGSVLSDEAWYGSAAAWTYTWEGLDLKKVISEAANPDDSKKAQIYYRAVEVSTPDWFRSVIAAEEENGHKAIDDTTQNAAGVLSEKNTVTNERNDCNLKLNKVWTGLGQGKTWPDGVTIDYQLIQHFHLALADMSKIEEGHIVPEYSAGKIFKSVDMTTTNSGAATADSVHPQAKGVNVGKPADGSTVIANITGLPVYGFLTATAADVEEAATAGVSLTEGTVYPIVYTYSAKETAVKKNGTAVGFKEQTVEAEPDETITSPVTYKATLTNELVSVTVEKDWNGLTPGDDESATIQLKRFKKDIEPEPETSFVYHVSVTGSEDALDSSGTITAIIYNSENEEVDRCVLNKNEWSHDFKLEIGETYHAAFETDGRILESVAPATVSNITEAASTELTAALKPAASGSVKVVVTGSPSGLWMNPLQDSNGTELSPQKNFNGYFNGQGGETVVLDGLVPGLQYRFQIGAEPSSVDGATYNNGFVTFTAVDGLITITLDYSGGGGETDDEDNVTITASVTSWITWPEGGNEYYLNHNTTTPPASGNIIVQIKSSWGNTLGEIELSPENNWTATETFNQKNLDGYGNGDRISQANCVVSNPIKGADAVYNNGAVSITGKYPESEASTAGFRSLQSHKLLTPRALAAPLLRAPSTITWTNNTTGLPADANPNTDELVDTITFSGSTWSKTWDELPKYSDDGKEYVYYAYETDYAGASGASTMETTYGIDEDGNLVVTNTPTYPDLGNVKVEKQVFYGTSLNTSARELTFTVGIFTDAKGTSRVSGQEDQTITVSEGKGEVTFTNLPAGTYYVYELMNGDPVTTSGAIATVNERDYTVSYENNGPVVSVGSTEIVTVKNTQQPFSLDIVKEDEEDGNKKLDGAEFKIHKLEYNTETRKISYVEDSEKTVTTQNGGKASFENLDIAYYEITESKAPEGYIMTGNKAFYIKVTDSGIQMVAYDESKSPDEWETTSSADSVTFTAAQAKTEETPAKNALATITNTPGSALPHTGGPGKRLFTILGMILTLGAGLLMWRRRKVIA